MAAQHKVKVITFLGRDVPIIMQNENGPCPLLALSNILLLRNQIRLSRDIPEVSQEHLLSLVAGFILDTNNPERLTACSTAQYQANMQQNVADAVCQLPKLTSGLDVNPFFHSGIKGFEFTDIVAIFDLLDIQLVHGWLVDPQDEEAVSAIGRRSYNALTERLLWLSGAATSSAESVSPPEAATAAEPAAATCSPTAATVEEADSVCTAMAQLEVGEAVLPAAPVTAMTHPEGDEARLHDKPDEAAELQAALRLSLSREDAASASQGVHSCQESAPAQGAQAADAWGEAEPADEAARTSDGAAQQQSPAHAEAGRDMPDEAGAQQPAQPQEDGYVVVGCNFEEGTQPAEWLHLKQSPGIVEGTPPANPACSGQPGARALCRVDTSAAVELPALDWTAVAVPPVCHAAQPTASSPAVQVGVEEQLGGFGSADAAVEGSEGVPEPHRVLPEAGAGGTEREAEASTEEAGPEASPAADPCGAAPAAAAKAGADAAEAQPLRREQGGGDERAGGDSAAGREREGGGREPREADARVIRAWLDCTSSQLTEHGLVCLHQGVRERQLAVFFRNNHFSTLFRHGGALYSLVTDLGYLHERDVVWEQLDAINGDTVYVDGLLRCPGACGKETQAASDYELALQLQHDEQRRAAASGQAGQAGPPQQPSPAGRGAAEGAHARDRGGTHRRQAPKLARPVTSHAPSKKCTIM